MKCRLESVVTREGRHLIQSTLRSKKGADAIIASNEPEWKRSLNTIADVNKYIDELDHEVAEHAKEKIPTLLMSIPGIGPVTAVVS
jgi:transposase